jgi:hypothetical protein
MKKDARSQRRYMELLEVLLELPASRRGTHLPGGQLLSGSVKPAVLPRQFAARHAAAFGNTTYPHCLDKLLKLGWHSQLQRVARAGQTPCLPCTRGKGKKC